MQLIFDSDHTADIKENMSTLQESVSEKFIADAIMDNFKHIINGNKENIQKQDINISRNEKNCNDIKLNDEELSAPVIEVDMDEVMEEKVISNSEQLVGNGQLNTIESHTQSNEMNKVELKIEQGDCDKENVKNSSNHDSQGELLLVKQEVNDILAKQVGKSTNKVERENDDNELEEAAAENRYIESYDDRMKKVREKLIKSVQIGKTLEVDCSPEDSPQENSTSVVSDVIFPSPVNDNINDAYLQNQMSDKNDITEEVTDTIVKDTEQKKLNEECSRTAENILESNCMETFTIQDDIDDSVKNTIPEPMNIDEVCKEIDITSDKEDNEITHLDSPGTADIQENEEDNNVSNIATDCHNVTEIVNEDKILEDIDKNEISELPDQDEILEIVHDNIEVSQIVDQHEVSEFVVKEDISEVIENNESSKFSVCENKVAGISDIDEVCEIADKDECLQIVQKHHVPEICDRDEALEVVDNDESLEIVDNVEVSEIADSIVNKDNVTKSNDQASVQGERYVVSKDEIIQDDRAKEDSQKSVEEKQETLPQDKIEKGPEKTTQNCSGSYIRLSNNLNILSDDEDESPTTEPQKNIESKKQSIGLEDDDDIMLIDEDINSKDSKKEKANTNKPESKECETKSKQNAEETVVETGEKASSNIATESTACINEEAATSTSRPSVELSENQQVRKERIEPVIQKPLLPDNFLKLSRKNIADMTREDLEEFCILKIVESIVDRSNLSEIKTKLRAMAQNLEEYKKKAMMLTKQNRDLEVVLHSVQEEQKRTNGTMVTPLKITRSVGMQVYMTDKLLRKKSMVAVPQPPVPPLSKTRSATNAPLKLNKIPSSPSIPVPRLIPANNAAIRGPAPQTSPANSGKQTNPVNINGVKNSATVQKSAEKRPIGRSQSVTVDLTDDEPPPKIASRGPTPPVRLVPSQNLLAPQRAQFAQAINTPRKVYIPISGPQGHQIKPGQTIMVKTSPPATARPRGMAPTITRMTPNPVRLNRAGQAPPRHPAALPDVVKQYQPPNWKALPPAPDLKLSKVENGIVISWKIEGYQEDSYEEIASYQLYAYQETTSPPSTALWKKIGDVKALPLPMACTLTQFMAGFKYYFAVRAVDVKSRVGPFSLPGSILLLNKM